MKPLKGEVISPADKSISHRAAIFASLAEGKSVIENYLEAADTSSTLSALARIGVCISSSKKVITIEGRGLYGFREPEEVIDCGNSGTAIRLFCGLLSGNPFLSVLTGDDSLKKRPMGRVIVPLSYMGAAIMARDSDRYPPLAIRGRRPLKGITYNMPVASAQLKSCLLIAGLYADGETKVVEPAVSRDHTEKMLSHLGVNVVVKDNVITIGNERKLCPLEHFVVPGDFSSAAFFIVAGLIVPGSEILVKSVGVNHTRTGLLNVLEKMGARVEIQNSRVLCGESVADIFVRYRGRLQAVEVGKEDVPLLIDEVPILCIAAATAMGTTVIKGAEELRVKESDRIMAVAKGLRKLGIDVEEYPDGLAIQGRNSFNKGVVIESFGDHRIAMSFVIAGLLTEDVRIEDVSSANISYPDFFETLNSLDR